MTIFFTSDTHWGHSNIIKYSNRPFRDVDHMNEALIKNWNSVVKPTDTIYHLGDFCFYSNVQQVAAVLSQLNGHKHFIFGNHDKIMSKPEIKPFFESMEHYKEIYIQDKTVEKGRQQIILLHYSMRVWNKSHYGSWQLYGHSHCSLPDIPTMLAFDVGVDCHDYTPLSYEQVKQIMSNKTWEPIDHHGE